MNKIYLALPLMLSLVLPARAQEAGKLMLPVIAVVDIQKIMRESNASKAVREQLSAKSTDYQKEITEGEKKLRSEGEALMKQRKDLGDTKFREKGGALDKEARELQEQVRGRKKTLDEAMAGALTKIRDVAAKIVAEEAAANGVNIVLDKGQVVVVDAKLDLTDEVMTKLNAKLPQVDVKFTEKK